MALIQVTYQRTLIENVLVVVEVPDDQAADVEIAGLLSKEQVERCFEFDPGLSLDDGDLELFGEDDVSDEGFTPKYRLVDGTIMDA